MSICVEFGPALRMIYRTVAIQIHTYNKSANLSLIPLPHFHDKYIVLLQYEFQFEAQKFKVEITYHVYVIYPAVPCYTMWQLY